MWKPEYTTTSTDVVLNEQDVDIGDLLLVSYPSGRKGCFWIDSSRYFNLEHAKSPSLDIDLDEERTTRPWDLDNLPKQGFFPRDLDQVLPFLNLGPTDLRAGQGYYQLGCDSSDLAAVLNFDSLCFASNGVAVRVQCGEVRLHPAGKPPRLAPLFWVRPRELLAGRQLVLDHDQDALSVHGV